MLTSAHSEVPLELLNFYQVGGSVRDEIMGIKPKDIDFACEAPSYEAMRKCIIEKGFVIKVEKPEFGTIKAINYSTGIDFTLCRKEAKYSDGRHPDAIICGSLQDDLSRRDFTCNAIAKDKDGNYIDPFGGISDISKGILRCVGKTDERMREDSLRMLRAIRFKITKNLTISSEIHEFLLNEENVQQLKNISTERIRQELTQCFSYDTLATIEALWVYKAVANYIFGERGIILKVTH